MTGLNNVKGYFATTSGGNTPQMLVNSFSEKIVKGEAECVIIVGGECLQTFSNMIRKEHKMPDWGSEHEEKNVTRPYTGRIGHDHPSGATNEELANGLNLPRQFYPLLDQAYRTNKKSVSVQEQLQKNGELFEKFNAVAASEKEYSWFPTKRSAKEIYQESKNNRWVTFPYPKFLNSVMEVNQGACIILASESFADKFRVKANKRVYLVGSSDCIEPGYFVSSRPNLGTSYGMCEVLESSLKSANLSQKDISAFDLYSCFPVAVNVALDCLKIDPNTDQRPLTVTGGLPYHGGPGNAYVIFSIAAMVNRLRGETKQSYGLVNGNGFYLTKHSCGIYSNRPISKSFERESTDLVQKRANEKAGTIIPISSNPNGVGIIETYVVDFSNKRKKPSILAIGKFTEGSEKGKRFISTYENPDDESIRQWMIKDFIGAKVYVTADKQKKNGKCTFQFQGDLNQVPSSGINYQTSPSAKL